MLNVGVNYVSWAIGISSPELPASRRFDSVATLDFLDPAFDYGFQGRKIAI